MAFQTVGEATTRVRMLNSLVKEFQPALVVGDVILAAAKHVAKGACTCDRPDTLLITATPPRRDDP